MHVQNHSQKSQAESTHDKVCLMVAGILRLSLGAELGLPLLEAVRVEARLCLFPLPRPWRGAHGSCLRLLFLCVSHSLFLGALCWFHTEGSQDSVFCLLLFSSYLYFLGGLMDSSAISTWTTSKLQPALLHGSRSNCPFIQNFRVTLDQSLPFHKLPTCKAC